MKIPTERPSSRVLRVYSFFSSETLSSPPPGRARRVISVFIAAYLLWQIALPLTYYFSDEKYDERFAWRMFSTLGWLQKYCTVTMTQKAMTLRPTSVPPQDLDLAIGDWTLQLQRYRTAVIQKLLRRQCNSSPWNIQVQLLRSCPSGDGRWVPAGQVGMNCITGEIKGALEE